MVEAIHQSSLGMMLRCGEQFRRRYIDNEIIPPSIAAGRGTGLHSASRVNLTQKISSGVDLPLSDILDATRDGYVKAFRSGVYLPKDLLSSKDKLLNEGLEDALRCAEVYSESIAPTITPLLVEEAFRVDVGLLLPLGGTMDHESDNRIDDLKTSGKKWAPGQIEREIQPAFYSLAHEKITGRRPSFKYHIMIARRNKEGKPTSVDYETQETTPTNKMYSALMAKLKAFIAALESGTFLPANPMSWWCDEMYCGYWRSCQYVGNGTRKNW